MTLTQDFTLKTPGAIIQDTAGQLWAVRETAIDGLTHVFWGVAVKRCSRQGHAVKAKAKACLVRKEASRYMFQLTQPQVVAFGL